MADLLYRVFRQSMIGQKHQLNNSVLADHTFKQIHARFTSLVDLIKIICREKFQFYGVFDALQELVTFPNF